MRRNPWNNTHGQELVEFALTLLSLTLLIMGIFDLGRVVIYSSSLHNAVREGSRYGVVHEGDVTGVIAKVKQMAFGLGPGMVVTIPIWDDETIRVRATYTFTPVTPLIGNVLPEGKILLVSSSQMWVEY